MNSLVQVICFEGFPRKQGSGTGKNETEKPMYKVYFRVGQLCYIYPIAVTKIPVRNNIQGEKFILSHGSEDISLLCGWNGVVHGSMNYSTTC